MDSPIHILRIYQRIPPKIIKKRKNFTKVDFLSCCEKAKPSCMKNLLKEFEKSTETDITKKLSKLNIKI